MVVLSTYDDDELVFEAILAGAQAYVLKDASEADVLATIRRVHRGESRLSPTIARKVMEQFRAMGTRAATQGAALVAGAETNPRTAPILQLEESLTYKEARTLALLAQGMSNKQIAAAAFLAERTVKNYVSRIMERLHAGSRLELAV